MIRFERDARLDAVIAFMEAHLWRPLTVGDIAKVAGLSPSRLSHLFSTRMGIGVMHLLKQLRMELAAELLETTDLPVKAIASKVGMGGDCGPAPFGRAFKAWSGGGTPARYRRMRQRPRVEAFLTQSGGKKS